MTLPTVGFDSASGRHSKTIEVQATEFSGARKIRVAPILAGCLLVYFLPAVHRPRSQTCEPEQSLSLPHVLCLVGRFQVTH